ncbi:MULTISPECIES: hypothetical protein [unclassified Mesorhizobium]|uniref:hypothetical protein n=1 Tax=unclassified Mesorhizobium TaxID=325217 RepID=UPI0003CE666D|nr:hypothetical protein [Mesorhizobium sp. LNJC391B00]ESY29457.1 hypothetical protein X749_16100 [Mesorhizobium sp. LNJC391B00]
MNNPWDVRPRADKGDATPDSIFFNVGVALTSWELLESALAELFDCLVSGSPNALQSNRSGIAAFIAVSSSSGRTQMLDAAIPRALKHSKFLVDAKALIQQVKDFGARRNEIAHGIVFDLNEVGFYLCPNNTNPNKWHRKGQSIGAATYQYTSGDLSHYISQFEALRSLCTALIANIQSERGAQD